MTINKKDLIIKYDKAEGTSTIEPVKRDIVVLLMYEKYKCSNIKIWKDNIWKYSCDLEELN